MNRDSSLKSNDVKMIILMVGDAKTGKNTIIKSILKNKQYTEKEHSSFKSYFFTQEELIGKTPVEVPIELRLLNSDEFETELKINKTFFSEALGAFVVNSIIDNNSFTNGEKWKDKIDLMCCLPNRFPLPIFLLINKCDLLTDEDKKENKNNLQYIQKDEIESYSLENQFFNTFLLGQPSNDNENIINPEKNEGNKIKTDSNKEENIKDLIVTGQTAFQELIKAIFGFRDIRDRFITQAGVIIDDIELPGGQHNKKSKCIIY